MERLVIVGDADMYRGARSPFAPTVKRLRTWGRILPAADVAGG
jgi:hypothetical protein